MNKIPPIKDVMTPFPYSIDAGKPLDDALSMLRQHEIHHLPVTREGKLFGLVLMSDILAAADSDERCGAVGKRMVLAPGEEATARTTAFRLAAVAAELSS